MKVTKNFFNKGYKIHLDNHSELWHLHSNCSQSGEFLEKAYKKLQDYKSEDHKEVVKVFRDLQVSIGFFPGSGMLASLAEMTNTNKASVLSTTDDTEIKENIKSGFWFVLTCAPWLVGIVTLLATLAKWCGFV